MATSSRPQRVAWVEAVGGLDDTDSVILVRIGRYSTFCGSGIAECEAVYMFQCAEGCRRLCGANRASLRQLRAVCCASPSEAFGVPEIAMCQREYGWAQLSVLGSAEVTQLVRTAVNTVCSGCEVHTTDELYEDEFVVVRHDPCHGFNIVFQFEPNSRWNIQELASMHFIRCGLTKERHYRRLARRFFQTDAVARPKPRRDESARSRTLRVYLAPHYLVEACDEVAMEEEAAEAMPSEEDNKEQPMKAGATVAHGDLRVRFVGTGCAKPCSTRASAAMALEWLGLCAMLIDCGSGTLGQLARVLPESLEVWLPTVDYVWISHHHLDHCGGVPAVLAAIVRAKARTVSDNADAAAKLRSGTLRLARKRSASTTLLAPPRVCQYWEAAQRALKIDDACVRVVPLVGAAPDYHDERIALTSIRVSHCRDAYALLARHYAANHRFAYSGDCRPSEAFARRAAIAGRTTLLVHEATFADDKADDAIAKKHCTVSEALHINAIVSPAACVLTHFSNRYVSVDADVCVAFDGLAIDVSTAPTLARQSKAYQACLKTFNYAAQQTPYPPPGPALLAMAPRKPSPPQAQQPCVCNDPLRLQLLEFYAQHAPSRLKDVDSLLPLFRRSFIAMNAKLLRKYGATIHALPTESDVIEQQPSSSDPSDDDDDGDNSDGDTSGCEDDDLDWDYDDANPERDGDNLEIGCRNNSKRNVRRRLSDCEARVCAPCEGNRTS